MAKVLVKGNEAIAQAAINAGCQCYFGYPITPQSEIGEYMGKHLPEMGRVFITAESELASINMVIGAGTTGTKAMTSSSSCGIALMQEAISAMCCAEVPGVIVPDSVMVRMAEPKTKEEQRLVGIEIAREAIASIRGRVAGVQISAPFGNVNTAIAVMK